MEFVLICNTQGIIEEIIHDSSHELETGHSLFPFVDHFSVSKILTFFQTIGATKHVSNWDINFQFKEKIKSFSVNGVLHQNQIILQAFEVNDASNHFLEELSEMNNQQNNLLRQSIKENYQTKPVSVIQHQNTQLKNELHQLKKKVIQLNQEKDKLLYNLTEEKNQSTIEKEYIENTISLACEEMQASIKRIKQDYLTETHQYENEVYEIIDQLNKVQFSLQALTPEPTRTNSF